MTSTVDVTTVNALLLSVQLQSIFEMNTVVSAVDVDSAACKADPDTGAVPDTVIDEPSVGDETVGLPTGVLWLGLLTGMLALAPLVVVVEGVVAVVGAVVEAPPLLPPLVVEPLPLLISYRL